MAKKGRAARQLGEKHGQAKLTEAAVRSVRLSDESPTVIARLLKVSPSLICQIKKKKIWRHVA